MESGILIDMKQNSNLQRGAVSGAVITIVLLGLAFVAAVGFGGWAYVQYMDYRDNFELKNELAVSEAVKEQADKDAEKLEQELKKPNRQFVGPDDYGRVTFDYPKTWSVYEATDVSDGRGTYEAYLSPIVVPPVDDDRKYATRVIIDDENIDEVLRDYERDVEEGNLKTSSFKANGVSATRLDGNFTDTIRGTAVVFKIRDKTLTVRTDSNTFKKDFEALIKTIEFNQ